MTEDVSFRTASSHRRNAISFISKGIYESSVIPMIQAQEVAQNSFDAIRSALKEGIIERGRIDISVGYDNITWSDNGIGMSEVELTNGFGHYGKSNKIGDLDSAGQYGIGVKSVINSSVIRIDTVKDGTRIKAWVSRDVLHVDSIEENTGRPSGTSITFVLGMRKLKQEFIPPVFLFPEMKSDMLPVRFAERAVQLAFYLPFFDDRIDVYMNGQKISPSKEFVDSFYYYMDFMGGKLFISPFSRIADTVLNVKGISYGAIGKKKGSFSRCVVRRNMTTLHRRDVQSVYVTSLVDVAASRSEVSNFPAVQKLLVGYNSTEEEQPGFYTGDSDLENWGPDFGKRPPNVLDLINSFKQIMNSVLNRTDSKATKGKGEPELLNAIGDLDLKTVVDIFLHGEGSMTRSDKRDRKLHDVVHDLMRKLTNSGFPIDYNVSWKLTVAWAITKHYFSEVYVDDDGFLTLNPVYFDESHKLRVGGMPAILTCPIPDWLRDLYYDDFKNSTILKLYKNFAAKKQFFIPYMEQYTFDRLVGVFDTVYAVAGKAEDLEATPSLIEPATTSKDLPDEIGEGFITISMVDNGVRPKKVKRKHATPKSINMSLMEFE
jgi:hypothetical protein